MNILWLKYAVEVAKKGSISAAAKSLYMEQPNLSRAIKDLEDTLEIRIFDRTTKGIVVTPAGMEFLQYAESILRQLDEVENMYKNKVEKVQRFSISVPRASYISAAFAEFSAGLDHTKPMEIFYKETNSIRAINNILHADYKLGVIRYAEDFEKQFSDMLEAKELHFEKVTDFTYCLIMKEDSPLAHKESITYADLKEFIEIAHADPYVPSLSLAAVKKSELPDDIDKRIFVFERASQFELLSSDPRTYMWVSPVPEDLLKRYGLVQRKCVDNGRVYRDVLIYRNDYKLSELDKQFIASLTKSKKKFIVC
ncbi:MAG: LysR family transcriptional regulator [Candidatus Coproplasma sp.]